LFPNTLTVRRGLEPFQGRLASFGCLLFAEHVQPAPRADEEKLARWVKDLDSAVFADREKATRELERQGEHAEPLLRKSLAADPPAEARRRIEGLLGKLNRPITSTEAIRSLRAVEVLEHIATPESCDLLKKVAAGAPEARLTYEAKAALERLKRLQAS